MGVNRIAQQSKGFTIGTFLKLVGIIIILLIFAGGIFLLYSDYKRIVYPKNETAANTTVVINNNTTIKQGAPQWLSTLQWLAILALALALLFLYLSKSRFNEIGFKVKAQLVFKELVAMNYPFYHEYDGKTIRFTASSIKKKKDVGALAHMLPGSMDYCQNMDIRFKRYLYRFWRYPRNDELMTPDHDPPKNEIFCVSVSAYNDVFSKIGLLGPMTFDETIKFVYEQEHGLKPSHEPVKAENPIEARMKEELIETHRNIITDQYTQNARERA